MSSIARYGYYTSSFCGTCPLFSCEIKYSLRTFENVLIFAFLFHMAKISDVTRALSQGGRFS